MTAKYLTLCLSILFTTILPQSTLCITDLYPDFKVYTTNTHKPDLNLFSSGNHFPHDTCPIVILNEISLKFQKFPKIILSLRISSPTLYIFIGFTSSNLKSNLALGLPFRLVELVPDKNDHLVIKQTKEETCFLFGHEIFTSYRRIPFFYKLDAYFRSSQGVLRDYYKVSSNNYVRSRLVKNRHQMVVKIILEHLNLSADACCIRRFPLDKSQRHIEFGISSYTQQLEKSGIAELIHSREQFRIKFVTVQQEFFAGYFASLVSPVGWSILVASVLLGCIIGTCIILQYRLSSKIYNGRHQSQSTPVLSIFVLMVRPFLEQSAEPRRQIRFIYAIWLLYCLVVSAIYRSNLTNTLSSPGLTQSIQTLRDLAADNKTIAGIGRKGRHGQSSDVRAIIAAELESTSISLEDRETFEILGKKFQKEKIEPIALDILQGRYNYLDDAALIEPAFGIMEKRYGSIFVRYFQYFTRT